MNTYGHDITIKEVLNGFIVTLGCETVVIEGQKSFGDAVDRLTKSLSGFLRDRDTVAKEYISRFYNDGKRAYKSGAMTNTTTTSIYPR